MGAIALNALKNENLYSLIVRECREESARSTEIALSIRCKRSREPICY